MNWLKRKECVGRHRWKKINENQVLCMACGKVIKVRSRYDDVLGTYIVIDDRGDMIGR